MASNYDNKENIEVDLTNFDQYDFFILALITKEKDLNFKLLYKNKQERINLELQVHYILPKHSKGSQEQINKVICTREDHILAHKCRFETYGDFNDQAAYLLMASQTKEGNEARSKAIQQKHKENKTGFFNTELQRELGKRPKSLYFLRKNSDKAKEWSALAKGITKKTSEKAAVNYIARGEFVGKNFGSAGGIKGQHPLTKERLKQTLKWKHQSKKEVITYGDVLSLEDVKSRLNQAVPESVKHTSGLSALIRGVEKKRYGWILEEQKD